MTLRLITPAEAVVVPLPGTIRQPETPREAQERLFSEVLDEHAEHVVVVTMNADGEVTLRSAGSDSATVNWMLDRAKASLFEPTDEDDEGE